VLLNRSKRGMAIGFKASCARLLPALALECFLFGFAIFLIPSVMPTFFPKKDGPKKGIFQVLSPLLENVKNFCLLSSRKQVSISLIFLRLWDVIYLSKLYIL
jgi:hypothetical protein